MSNTELDVNVLIQSFSEKIGQLTNDNIIKDAMIKQLQAQIEELINDGDEKNVKD